MNRYFQFYPKLLSFYRSARIISCGGAKIEGTPPRAQTPGPNWLNFFVESPQEDTFRGIGGFLNFILEAKIMSFLWLILECFWTLQKALK